MRRIAGVHSATRRVEHQLVGSAGNNSPYASDSAYDQHGSLQRVPLVQVPLPQVFRQGIRYWHGWILSSWTLISWRKEFSPSKMFKRKWKPAKAGNNKRKLTFKPKERERCVGLRATIVVWKEEQKGIATDRL
jgi:hypothetical protein